MFQMLRDDLAEDDLLGEILRADRDRCSFVQPTMPAPTIRRSHRRQYVFDPFESSIGHHRDQGSRNRTGQQQRRIDGGQAAKNKDTESTAANGGGNRRRPDRRHGRDAQAGQNRPRRQREFDLPEQLPPVMPMAMADSRTAGSTLRMPVSVLRRIGRSA